jgi:hypothetical protein
MPYKPLKRWRLLSLWQFEVTGQTAPQTKITASKEDRDIEACLAPLTGEVITAILDSGEFQGREQGTMDGFHDSHTHLF